MRCAPSLLFYYTEPKMTKWYNWLFSVAKAPTMLAKMRLEEFAVRMQRGCPLPPIYYQVTPCLCWFRSAAWIQDLALPRRRRKGLIWRVLHQSHATCPCWRSCGYGGLRCSQAEQVGVDCMYSPCPWFSPQPTQPSTPFVTIQLSVMHKPCSVLAGSG